MKIFLTRSIFTAAALLMFFPLTRPACAQPASPGSPVDSAYAAILTNAKVIKTLEDIKADDERTFAEQKRITEIPAPPYKEKVRAEYFLKRFQELGFKDAAIDSEGNVIGLRKGSGGGRPKLVVSAHLDTVFPESTDVTVKEKDGAILAPGIGDDSRGLAALLSLLPVGGSALVWIPAVIWLFFEKHWGWGIFLLVWGAALSGLDNVVRPLLISGRARISALAVFVGVLGGIPAFGAIGVIAGPVVLSLVLALIDFAEESSPKIS